jgi:hypothetical protein
MTSFSKEKGKGGKSEQMGKAILNLNNFAEAGTIRTEVLQLTGVKKDKASTKVPNIVVCAAIS